MERIRNQKLYLIFLLCFCLTSNVSIASTVEQYVIEARQKIAEKDYSGAAVLYQKALKLKNDHPIARQELKMLLIEGKISDPEAEYSDAEWALIEEARKERNDL